ncbi:hypothetical protein TYRP_022606 [Tyrophagus putrescentiae]|nr:hypothetical protein TYRP_022606 [Tyrophagus putrescentiae]
METDKGFLQKVMAYAAKLRSTQQYWKQRCGKLLEWQFRGNGHMRGMFWLDPDDDEKKEEGIHSKPRVWRANINFSTIVNPEAVAAYIAKYASKGGFH